MVSQLSRARSDGGQFSNFVMIRLVRLTIETNALTGTFARPTTYGRSSHLCLAGVAIASFVLYAAFPVG